MLAAMQLATPHTPKRKARILVVDDDPGLLRLLTIRLRAENYEVEAVESAALALAATSRFRPELDGGLSPAASCSFCWACSC